MSGKVFQPDRTVCQVRSFTHVSVLQEAGQSVFPPVFALLRPSTSKRVKRPVIPLTHS